MGDDRLLPERGHVLAVWQQLLGNKPEGAPGALAVYLSSGRVSARRPRPMKVPVTQGSPSDSSQAMAAATGRLLTARSGIRPFFHPGLDQTGRRACR